MPVTLDDVARAVRRSGHSHFPVYQDDLDHLLGVLFVKDLFHPGPLGIEGIRAVGGSDDQDSPVLDVAKRVREPYIAPESRLSLEILAEMRRARRAFAVVVDEYGGVAGSSESTSRVFWSMAHVVSTRCAPSSGSRSLTATT